MVQLQYLLASKEKPKQFMEEKNLPALLLWQVLGLFQKGDLSLAATRFMLNKLACCWSRGLNSSAQVKLAVLSTYSININYPVSYLSWKHCAGLLSGHICRGSGRSLGEKEGGENLNGWTFMKTMHDTGQEQVVLHFNHSCYLFCFNQRSCSFWSFWQLYA